MSTTRIMQTTLNEGDGDSSTTTLRISANARARRSMLTNRRQFVSDLIRTGHVKPHGCSCGKCAAGWDCCGRMFVRRTTVNPARGGIHVVQHWARNI